MTECWPGERNGFAVFQQPALSIRGHSVLLHSALWDGDFLLTSLLQSPLSYQTWQHAGSKLKNWLLPNAGFWRYSEIDILLSQIIGDKSFKFQGYKNIPKRAHYKVPFLCARQSSMPPPHTMRYAEESQKLPIITLSLSTVHPICAVMIWAFEALMAALAGKIMAPIIFNELHQEVSMGLLSLEQRHVGKQLCFLVIKMAVSLCEAKEQCFPFWALLDLKGPRKAAWKETSPSPCRCPLPWLDVYTSSLPLWNR